MSYPKASDVIAIVRSLLMADATTGGDAIYTDERIVPMLGVAWREMWDSLATFNAARPRITVFWLLKAYTNAFYPVAAGLRGFTDIIRIEECAVDRSIDISAGTDSGDSDEVTVATGTAHGLASNDRAFVVNAGEGLDGEWFTTVVDATHLQLNGSYAVGMPAADTGRAKLVVAAGEFTDLSPLSIWKRRAVSSTLGEYQWESDRLRFHGASTARLLSINATAAPPAAPKTANETLRVENCENFLGYRTASLMAGAAGREDLSNRYAIMAIGPNQKPDGSGGFLAGVSAAVSRSLARIQAQRPA